MQVASLPTVPQKPKLADTGQGFAKGNCTAWVANRRNATKQPVTWRGDARMWFENAKKQGYNLGAVPKPGAIYVSRQENSYGSNRGHVAFVEKVEGGKVLLSEMNWVGKGKVSYRWIPADKKGVGYIYDHP